MKEKKKKMMKKEEEKEKEEEENEEKEDGEELEDGKGDDRNWKGGRNLINRLNFQFDLLANESYRWNVIGG